MSDILHSYYELYIGGKKLDGEKLSYIESLVIDDTSSGSDLLTITLSDPNFVFLQDDMFVEETKVMFKGGWYSDVSVSFEGFISLIEVNFPSDGIPILTISCMDTTHVMNRLQKSRTWNNKRRSDVAKEIFSEYGLKANIDPTKEIVETISQSDSTDIQFLVSLASEEVDDYLVYVEGNNGYFKKKQRLSTPQHSIMYKLPPFNLLDLSLTLNKQEKKEAVVKSDINPKTKQVETGVANESTPRELQGDPVKSTSDPKGTSKKVVHDYFGGSKWENREEVK